MTITTNDPDIERLAAGFHPCFSHFEAADGLFADDTFFDLLPPMVRP